LYVDDGRELTERNFHYAELDWSFPIEQAALVCVDCWAWHYSRECLDRIDEIMRKRVSPLIAAARRHGLQIVHGPASPVAEKSEGWLNLLKHVEKQKEYPDSPAWPSVEFMRKTGDYQRFARPRESHEAVNVEHRRTRRWYHECCTPIAGEPVILNGEELHRWCARHGVLHLFYVGFNTNACVVMRDYGILAMMARGYHGILVRDATTGMEIADTVADMICTRGQIASREQFDAYTVSTDQLIEALRNQMISCGC
jgi:nicotinamidase-related amidase